MSGAVLHPLLHLENLQLPLGTLFYTEEPQPTVGQGTVVTKSEVRKTGWVFCIIGEILSTLKCFYHRGKYSPS